MRFSLAIFNLMQWMAVGFASLLLFGCSGCQAPTTTVPPAANSPEAIATFWNWVSNNHSYLGSYGYDNHLPNEALNDALHSYNPKLSAHIVQYKDGNNGREDSDNTVILGFSVWEEPLLYRALADLIDGAPALPGFEIEAFKKRSDEYLHFPLTVVSQLGEGSAQPPSERLQRFDATEIRFGATERNHQLDLVLYFPGYKKEKSELFQTGTNILLNQAIGESDLKIWIGRIGFREFTASVDTASLPTFTDFRAYFDAFKSRQTSFRQQ